MISFKQYMFDIAKIIHSNAIGSELNYLKGNIDDNCNNLVKDRKIQDGVDTRSYKVKFDKIHKMLPNFKCKWTVEKGIIDLLKKLKDLELSKETFNRREYYRLQQIEFLHKENYIDDDLFWLSK